MEQTPEPAVEPRFDLQQMLRELADEVAAGGASMPACPPPMACHAGQAPAQQPASEIVPDGGHG